MPVRSRSRSSSSASPRARVGAQHDAFGEFGVALRGGSTPPSPAARAARRPACARRSASISSKSPMRSTSARERRRRHLRAAGVSDVERASQRRQIARQRPAEAHLLRDAFEIEAAFEQFRATASRRAGSSSNACTPSWRATIALAIDQRRDDPARRAGASPSTSRSDRASRAASHADFGRARGSTRGACASTGRARGTLARR